jgi:hypothetical protein
MTDLKFKEYDRGNVRAYFKRDRKLYCIQPNQTIELLICSRNGEPSHPVDNPDQFIFFGFDGARWTWNDLLTCFSDCLYSNMTIRRMNTVFGG